MQSRTPSNDLFCVITTYVQLSILTKTTVFHPGMSSEVAASGDVAVNGHGAGPEDEEVRLMTEEELEKGKMRPPDIDQDMKVS